MLLSALQLFLWRAAGLQAPPSKFVFRRPSRLAHPHGLIAAHISSATS